MGCKGHTCSGSCGSSSAPAPDWSKGFGLPASLLPLGRRLLLLLFFTLINNNLVRLYEKACKGEKHKDIKTLDYLVDVCFSMHAVCEPPEGYKVCVHA